MVRRFISGAESNLDSRMEGGFLVVSGGLQKAQALPYKARHPRKLTHIMSLRS